MQIFGNVITQLWDLLLKFFFGLHGYLLIFNSKEKDSIKTIYDNKRHILSANSDCWQPGIPF